jgi:hypothetical protein
MRCSLVQLLGTWWLALDDYLWAIHDDAWRTRVTAVCADVAHHILDWLIVRLCGDCAKCGEEVWLTAERKKQG